MALEKQRLNDKIEITEDGTIRVREVTRILEDGKVISQSYTNSTLIDPGADIPKDDSRINRVLTAVHTPKVIADYKAKKKAKEDKLKTKTEVDDG